MAYAGRFVMKSIHLMPVEKKALQTFIGELESAYTQQPRILLIGSKARGDSSFNSDIDVLVILPKEDRFKRRNILTIASRVSLNYDVLLNPIIIGEARLKKQSDFSFYRNVAEDAVRLVIKSGELVFSPGSPLIS
jgi:predicted nucleotidyltransferase